MPSELPPSGSGRSRRCFLATAGTALATGLAGCGGWLPGRSTEVDVATRPTDDRLLWEFPPDTEATPDDDLLDGLGYASVTADRPVQLAHGGRALRLVCNATIGSISEDGAYAAYETDWFRFRLSPPSTYDGLSGFEMFAEPPGQWEDFSSWYDRQGPRRRFTVAMREVNTDGTILVPILFFPGSGDLPERFECAFTLQASTSDPIGKTVRVSGRGRLPLANLSDT